MENSVLNQRVVVDTPGTGDPSVLEEMVRDFLPICDRLDVYHARNDEILPVQLFFIWTTYNLSYTLFIGHKPLFD